LEHRPALETPPEKKVAGRGSIIYVVLGEILVGIPTHLAPPTLVENEMIDPPKKPRHLTPPV